MENQDKRTGDIMEKQAETLTSIDSKLESLNEKVDTLYKKVILGNGNQPLSTRMVMAEDKIDKLSSCQSSCDYISRTENLDHKLDRVEGEINHEIGLINTSLKSIKDTLEKRSDVSQFKRNKIYSAAVDGIRMVIVAVIATAGSITFTEIYGGDSEPRESTEYNQERAE